MAPDRVPIVQWLIGVLAAATGVPWAAGEPPAGQGLPFGVVSPSPAEGVQASLCDAHAWVTFGFSWQAVAASRLGCDEIGDLARRAVTATQTPVIPGVQVRRVRLLTTSGAVRVATDPFDQFQITETIEMEVAR